MQAVGNPASPFAFVIMKANTAQVGSAFAGIAVSFASASRYFPNGKGVMEVDGNDLPTSNPAFMRGMLTLASKHGLAHYGAIDQESFKTLCIKLGTPNSKIIKEAEAFLEDITGGAFTWEDADKAIKAKYGWTLASHDLDGLIDHLSRKAEAEDAKKANPMAGLV